MWDIASKYLQTDEVIEYIDGPSMLSCVLAYLWGGFTLVLVVGAIIIGFVIGFASRPTTNGAVGLALGMVATSVATYALLGSPAFYVILRRLSTRYAVSTRGLITRTGILTNSMKSISFKHVTSVEVKETVLGRVFRYAHLYIDTSGSGSAIECRWKYVKAAHRVKHLIEKRVGDAAPSAAAR